ncbi:uncharacterized protein LOC142771466 [Rhipicephalus microplus]|uniref:uncharacterized protein LOC142771466 n=1 Tax=Rhipicephalus microplus TaxID=6941 RepID=UPI003F6B1847
MQVLVLLGRDRIIEFGRRAEGELRVQAVRGTEGGRAAHGGYSIKGIQGELRAEREQRIELRKQLGASRELEEATTSLLKQMKGDLRKEREGWTELEQRVKELMALCPGPEWCETEGVGSGEGDRQEGTGEKRGQRAAVSGHSTEASRTYSSVGRQSSSRAETQDRRQREKQVKQTRTPSQTVSQRLENRRVLVIGDSNVARVRDGVFKTVKEDGRVMMEAQSGKSMVDALAKAQEVVENSMEGENLVIIHAGLNDVLKGKDQNLQRQLKDGMRKLREASGSVHVTICTVPEVWGQSRGIERRVVEANCGIKGMSRQLGYNVMEVNQDVYEPGARPFAQDGINYSGATGRTVGNRMGRQATAFLGEPRALRPTV